MIINIIIIYFENVQILKMSKEVVIEPNVKLECVPKFCYLGDTLGAGGGVEEAARARVRCAWAKFQELSPILTARGASLRPGVHHTPQRCIIPARGASYRPGVHHTGQGCIIPARGASYRPGVHHTGQGCIIPYKGKDIQGLCPECIDIWD